MEAWTLELGAGMQINSDSVAKGVQGIKNYLAYKEILYISGLPIDKPASQEITFSTRSKITKYYAPSGGMIQSRVELGSSVKAGERLYQILIFNKEGKLLTILDVLAQDNGLVYDISSNQAVNEGEFVLGII